MVDIRQMLKQRAFMEQHRKQAAQRRDKSAVDRWEGIMERARKFLNDAFRTGPGLHPSLSKYVSEGRPRGAPKDSAKGTKATRKPRHV